MLRRDYPRHEGGADTLPVSRDFLLGVADSIEARLDKLPRVGGRDAPYGRFRRAVEQLADDLRRTPGMEARIDETPSAGGVHRVRILGIQASSTAGVHGALRNWVAAARRAAA